MKPGCGMKFSKLNSEMKGLCPSQDEALMLQALDLARQAQGRAAPNPRVGVLISRAGEILARAGLKRAGLPHAEVEALNDLRCRGLDPTGATLFVTLEPCNHHGRTPPCTQAILEAGLRKVVIGTLDPNPDVAGGGAEALRQAGVEVIIGVAEDDCRELIADFLVWKTSPRPYLILKLASTLDGRIATRSGHSRWVTGPEARHAVHELRGRVDAVLIGGGTLRLDDPELTCRTEGRSHSEPQPKAVVVSSSVSLEDLGRFRLFAERCGETFLLTSEENRDRLKDLADGSGLRILGLPLDSQGRGLDLSTGLAELRRDHGVFTILCEGGGRLAANLLDQQLVAEFHLFLAPKVLADGQARPVLDGLAPITMDQGLDFTFSEMRSLGEDLLLVLRRKAN